MLQTTDVASDSTPSVPKRRPFSRRAMVGIVAVLLIGGAVGARFLLVPPAMHQDPLRGDSDEAVLTLGE